MTFRNFSNRKLAFLISVKMPRNFLIYVSLPRKQDREKLVEYYEIHLNM